MVVSGWSFEREKTYKTPRVCFGVFGPTRPTRTSLLSRVFERAQHAIYYPVPQQLLLLSNTLNHSHRT